MQSVLPRPQRLALDPSYRAHQITIRAGAGHVKIHEARQMSHQNLKLSGSKYDFVSLSLAVTSLTH
jgi:hypothetical protein